MPPALNQIWRFAASTLLDAAYTQSPLVIWFFTAPVTPS